jgi:DnaJ like chaperone protein
VGWQTIVLVFVLLDIAGLGFTLDAPFWLTPWVIVNVTALVLGALSWSEDRRLQTESSIARERQAEKVREAERRNRAERKERRQRQAERLRQAEQQLREAERRRGQEEKERKAQRQGQQQREQPSIQSRTEWWTVLEVTPSASKDEIVRNYRRKIQQCHPDRVAGLAPEFLRLAEETTKRLNLAYEQAIRTCRQGAHCP